MRHWNLPDTHNVRDLGGYKSRDGRQTQWRRILRADNLYHLAPASLHALSDAGLALVVDLRNDRELAAEPNPFAHHPGTTYLNVSLFEALAPIGSLGGTFDMADRYRTALDRCGSTLSTILGRIADAPDGMVVFHCTAGKDRTGILAAMILSLVGVDEQEIIADYALTAEALPLLDRLRRRSLDAGVDPIDVERVLASDAATMASTLHYLNAIHGGAASYFDRHGFDAGQRQRLVNRLCS